MGKPTERMLYLLLSQFYDKPVIKAILEVVGEEFEYHVHNLLCYRALLRIVAAAACNAYKQ